MFGLVLSVCNYMNEGSEFGSAFGFKLDSLEQVTKHHTSWPKEQVHGPWPKKFFYVGHISWVTFWCDCMRYIKIA